MQSIRKRFALKPWHGLILFSLVIVFLLFGAAPMQAALGMGGLALTELIILAFGVLPLFFFKPKAAEVFPVKRPRVRHIFGTVLIWIGCFLFSMVATLILSSFFPSQMSETSDYIRVMFTSVPGVIAFLIVAVMPAICEEALCRGFILTSMRPLRREWLIILVMGLLFGVMHLDPMRFLATSILGAGLAFVLLKTKNILMPMLFHFLNNALSLGMSFLVSGHPELTDADAVSSALSSGTAAATYLILGSVAPLLLFCGWLLLRDKKQTSQEESAAIPPRKHDVLIPFIACLIAGAVMLFSGVAVLTVSSFNASAVSIQRTTDIGPDEAPYKKEFTVPDKKTYALSYNIKTERGLIGVTIEDESGKEVYFMSAKEVFGTDTLTLAPGTYTITFTFVQKDVKDFYEKHNLDYTDSIPADLGMTGEVPDKTHVQIVFIMM